MKPLFRGLFIFFLLPLFSCTFHKSEWAHKTVVKVNSSKLPATHFAQRLAEELRPFNALAVNNKEILTKVKDRIVKDYIISVVTRDWAATHNIVVSRKELKTRIQDIRSHYPDDLSFRKALAEEKLTLITWSNKIKDSLLQKKVQLKMAQLVPRPTEAELKAYYKNNKSQFSREPRVQIQQIVVNTKDEARQILKALRARKDPEKMAKEFSITPEGQRGGHLGWIEKKVSPTFQSAFDLKIRRWGKIVKSPFGYHIFRVLAKKPKQILKFNEVRVEIFRILLEKREQAYFSTWLERQIRKASVYRNQALIDGIVAKTQGE